MSGRGGQLILVGIGVVLLALVLWLPNRPASSEAAVVAAADTTSAESRLERAVEQVSSGQDPMAGIMVIRELAEGDPPNLEALVWLGIFSIQSGQTEKARERFNQVLALQPNHLDATWQLALLDMEEGKYDRAVVGFETCMAADSSYRNGLFFTARCYEGMGKTEAALIRYREYLPFAPDTVVSNRVNSFIERLESGKTGSTES